MCGIATNKKQLAQCEDHLMAEPQSLNSAFNTLPPLLLGSEPSVALLMLLLPDILSTKFWQVMIHFQ